jgi:hypothetical protein
VPKKVSSVSARDGASAATSTSSAPFPLLRSAMVAFEAAFKVSQALPPSISPRSASPAWRSAHNLEDETQRVVCDLYATEMLPEILGGIWKKTDSTVWIPSTGCGRRPVFSDYHELFDHPSSIGAEARRGRRRGRTGLFSAGLTTRSTKRDRLIRDTVTLRPTSPLSAPSACGYAAICRLGIPAGPLWSSPLAGYAPKMLMPSVLRRWHERRHLAAAPGRADPAAPG